MKVNTIKEGKERKEEKLKKKVDNEAINPKNKMKTAKE